MKPKTTLILILFLALAVPAFVLTNQGGDPLPSEQASDDDRVTVLDAEVLGPTLTQITFDGGLAIPLKLERIAGKWHVTSPHHFPANHSAINELLTSLANLKGQPTDQQFGPVPDQGGIQLVYGEKQISLSIGKRLGSGKAGIARFEEGQVEQFIVDDVLHEIQDQVFEPGGHYAYYSKKIRPLLMPEFQRIEIATVDSTSVLRQVDGRWVIGLDEHAERALEHQLGGHSGVADYFKLLEAIEVTEFVDYFSTDDLANFGLNRPVAIVRFVPIGSDTEQADRGITLRVGVPADLADQTRYVSFGRSDNPYHVVFTTPSPIAIAFGQDAKRFRDPRLAALTKTLIRKLTIEQPKHQDVVVRFNPDRTESLSPTEPALGNYPVNIAPQGRKLLNQLLDLRAIAFLEADQGDLKQRAKIELYAPFENKTESLRVFEEFDAARRGESVLVRRGDETTLLRVERSVIDQLLRLPERLTTD